MVRRAWKESLQVSARIRCPLCGFRWVILHYKGRLLKENVGVMQ